MIKINKAGWVYIVLTITIGFAAVNTGNNLIYLIASALLSYMLISGIFGRRNLRDLDVTLEPPPEIFAGTEIPLGIKLVNNRKFMPAFLIRVLINGHQPIFSFVNSKSEAVVYCTMKFPERGKVLINEISICSVFPFNFFTRYKKISRNFYLTIFPAPMKCDDIYFYDRQTKLKGESSTLSIGYDSDIISIRDYTSGDPLKYISWKSTAKTGVLKTKELAAIELQQIMIDFDRIEKRNLEAKISCITYLVLKFIRSNIPVGLIIDGEVFAPNISIGHKLKILQKLALYGQS